MIRGLFTAFALLAGLTTVHAQNGSGPRQNVPEQAVNLRQGFVVMVRMPETVHAVAVGSGEIADVTPRSDRILAVTGKSAGVTNIVALDQYGEPTATVLVTVSTHEPSKIYGHSKGPIHEYWAYQCNPVCVRIGDTFEGAPPLPTLPRGSIVNVTTPSTAITPVPAPR